MQGKVRARCEWDLMKVLRRKKALGALRKHRETHICRDDFLRIRDMGLNAVRVPFGYWIVLGPSSGDPYEGPAIEWVDRAVEWAAEAGLQVLLDLHASPGGESAEAPCGRRQRPVSRWDWPQWRMDESLQALEILALRYKDFSHVTGIAVCNEPSNEIPTRELATFYDKAVDTVRLAGMPASRVAVVLPVFQRSVSEFAECWNSVTGGRHANICFDMHYYHCFGDHWHGRTLAQQLRAVQENADELRRYPCVVGEWSLALGRAALASSVAADQAMAIFAQAQRAAYEEASHGWFFWTWKDGNGAEWDLRSCHQTGLFSDSACPPLPEWSEGCEAEDPLEEQLDPSPSHPVRYGDQVCLRAFHGGFMEVNGSEVVARFSELGKEHFFIICRAGGEDSHDCAVLRSGDSICLRAHSGRYLTVNSKGKVIAWPAGLKGRCQSFELHFATGSPELRHRGSVYLKSRTYGVVIDADPTEDSLQARFKDFGHWQKFVVDVKLPHAIPVVSKGLSRRPRKEVLSDEEALATSTPHRDVDEVSRKRLSEASTPPKLRDVRRRLRFKSGVQFDLCNDTSGADF